MPKPPPTSGVITRNCAGSVLKTAPSRPLISQPPCVLAYSVQRPDGGVEVGDRGARLHRCDDDAVVHDGQPRDVRRGGEQRVGRRLVADLPVERDVVRHVGPHQRHAGTGRRGDIGDGRLDRVIHGDQVRGIARGRHRIGDDERHTIADMAHRAIGERRMWRARHVGAIAILHWRGAGHRCDTVRVQVGRRIDCLNPGDRSCRRRVDGAELRCGVRAAQHDAVQHAREDDIVGVAAVALQQARILHATDRLGEAKLGHGRCLRGSSVAGLRSMHAPDAKGQEAWKIVACAF